MQSSNMINDINGFKSTSTGATTKGGKTDVANTGQTQDGTSTEAASDSLELSSQAQLLSRLETEISKLPDIDQARVDALKDAISQGQFDIDNSSLADVIISLESQLSS